MRLLLKIIAVPLSWVLGAWWWAAEKWNQRNRD